MNTLKLRIERTDRNGRNHQTHLSGPAVMHLDLVEKLAGRAMRYGVRPELVETVWENGYTREDGKE